MINKLLEIKEQKDTRSGFGDAMTILGEQNKNVVALCADLTDSLKLGDFKNKFPDRFFQTGIAEANMIGLAAGMTIGDKIPFATTFANFATSRVYDQIRQSVAYSNKNVKICASHAGITLGEDGATHQILEDIGMMKMLPNMTVINTCDYNQTYNSTLAISEFEGPVYLRFGRPKVVNFTPKDQKFEIGKGIKLLEGNDITIIATGHLVWESLLAAKVLIEKGYKPEIINIHTIKPLDNNIILESVKKTNKVLVAEEHQLAGGLGESVASMLAQNYPVPMQFVAMNDTFGQSGTPAELMKYYKLDSNEIILKSIKLLEK